MYAVKNFVEEVKDCPKDFSKHLIKDSRSVGSKIDYADNRFSGYFNARNLANFLHRQDTQQVEKLTNEGD
jgi:hypothetical protein